MNKTTHALITNFVKGQHDKLQKEQRQDKEMLLVREDYQPTGQEPKRNAPLHKRHKTINATTKGNTSVFNTLRYSGEE